MKQRLEQCHGLPADGCRLLLNGKELRSGRLAGRKRLLLSAGRVVSSVFAVPDDVLFTGSACS